VINSGSSTLKYKLFEQNKSLEMLCGATLKHSGNFDETFEQVFQNLKEGGFIQSIDEIELYGHRVVHGGEEFSDAIVVDDEVIAKIDALCALAPLHNPANLEGIKKAQAISGGKPQIAVFDTAFHQSMPPKSFRYAIANEYYFKEHIRRYGFHGISHEYVANQAAKLLQKPLSECNLITVHLGNGASICAIQKGKSIDTTMGFTPLEGLMMGTRCGDIDPSIIFELYRKKKSIDEIERMCNTQSGLLGICGESDFVMIEKMIDDGHQDAILAFEMFTHRVKKYIGAYKELLGDVDAVVFTGGIGENSARVRLHSTTGVDEQKNQNVKFGEIQKDGFNTKILVIATNEELLIAQKCVMLASNKK